MYDRFNNSARTVTLRARDNAAFEKSLFIEPRHILIALRDLHPELFARIADDPVDVEALKQELRLTPNPGGMSQAEPRIRFSDRSKRVLLSATAESRLSSQHWWEVDERHRLLGLLRNPESPMVALLIGRGMTPDVVRQRLCIAVK
jgi:ATP-dependent Clp protease ATP-binding subunit ClpA